MKLLPKYVLPIRRMELVLRSEYKYKHDIFDSSIFFLILFLIQISCHGAREASGIIHPDFEYF